MSISKKIINSVAAEMMVNAQDMGEVVIIPNTFDVHIHTDDFRTVRHFLKELRKQTVKRLDRVITKHNKSSAERGWLGSALNRVLGFEAVEGRKEYRRVEEHWDINFHECNGKVRVDKRAFEMRKGEVCTISSFSSSRSPSLGSQFGTFVTVYQEDDSVRTPLTDESPPPDLDQNEIPTVRDLESDGDTPYFATIDYKYKGFSEWHTYRMFKREITIGRAPEGSVDLALADGSAHIAARHLEIRADAATGKFFLRSLGAFGTTVNGKRASDAATEGACAEVELPDGARIALAGGEVLINFSKAK